jgi:hypothetical protein
MEGDERARIVAALAEAFGAATDVTESPGQPLHVLLPELELPDPWKPSPTRALTIWRNFPAERPEFYVDPSVVGGDGQPPRTPHDYYHLGETWRGFSFNFSWVGEDEPALAVQMWMTRFEVETN